MKAPAGQIPRRRVLKALSTAPLIALGPAGCSGERADAAGSLRVATPWPRSVRDGLEREFAERLGADQAPVVWIAVPEGTRLDRFLRRAARLPDVLLGGLADDYARLAAVGLLEGLSNGVARPYWWEIRQTAVELVKRPERKPRMALGDPRVDPFARAWSLNWFDQMRWTFAYAALIGWYGGVSPAAGWGSSSARAAFDQGRADETVLEDAAAEERGLEFVGGPKILEAAAIRAGSPRAPLARDFLKFVVERTRATLGPVVDGDLMAAVDARDLLVDLLGATLVDAGDELRIASEVVHKTRSGRWAGPLLHQFPPWPPASVGKLLAKSGDAGLELVETLVGQIAPEAGQRLWLTQSWLKPSEPIRRATLEEIARAEGGRLTREPRFRAWLRAEWTQWARQRYRWVARMAASGERPPATDLTS